MTVHLRHVTPDFEQNASIGRGWTPCESEGPWAAPEWTLPARYATGLAFAAIAAGVGLAVFG